MSLLHLWQEGVVIVVLTSIPVAKRTCEPTKGCCLWTSMRPQVPFAYKMEKMFILFQGFRTCQHDGRCSRRCQGAEGGWAGWWVSPRGCRRGLCGAGFLEDGDHDDFGVDGVGDVEVVKVLRILPLPHPYQWVLINMPKNHDADKRHHKILHGTALPNGYVHNQQIKYPIITTKKTITTIYSPRADIALGLCGHNSLRALSNSQDGRKSLWNKNSKKLCMTQSQML